ncbi:UDP-GlcNAc:betaGal beta-1,3-N-acetylglucosaminyltransferase 7-like [Octopus sinensis]|uniref:Hexosyltransferase n=1 Tax=Octopus sinensis TaxID=2607531 RepID=A0A7E6EIB9_9MOLL|nr:UDP-GlcNAc:betaGal beta-1,3-N-acetylglucosaminyltransferase 7-like [Octopus sinensis]
MFLDDLKHKNPFPCPTTYRAALLHYVDITSPLRREVLQLLRPHATDSNDVHVINSLIENSGGHSIKVITITLLIDSNNVKRREIIRKTWGNMSAYPFTVKRIFSVAHDSSLREKILSENEIYNDILYLSEFPEMYSNLALKSNLDTKYVAKVDDDVFLNLKELISKLENINKKNFFLCKEMIKTVPIRRPDSLWY